MNSAKRENVIRKVKKLYALASGTTSREEAESATLTAQALLREYNLTLTDADLQEEETSQCSLHQEDTGTRHHSAWVVYLANTTAKAFDCRALFGARLCEKRWRRIPYVSFIGVEPDVSLAKHTFSYLCGVARRHKDKRKSSAQLNHWRIGFAEAVGSRLVENAEQQKKESPREMALVLRKDDLLSRYMAEHYPEIKTEKCRKQSVEFAAYLEGLAAGDCVPLSTPVEQGKEASKALSV